MTGGDRRTFELDFNAGGPTDERVLARYVEVERATPGNPSSLHASGRRARAVLEDARVEIVEALGLDSPDEVVFTSGGTESDNLAVLGFGAPERRVLCGAVEHPAVFEPAQSRGLVEVPVDPDGVARFDLWRDRSTASDRESIGLVCLVHAQSETGCIQPLAAAAELARDLGVPLHVDAAQSLGRLRLDEVVACADSIALSMHKAGGPKGCGLAILRARRDGAPVPVPRALSRGGGQERGLRPGTVPVALAAAAARTVSLAVAERAARAERMRAARDAFAERLADRAAAARPRPITPRAEGTGLPNTWTVCFEGVVDGRLLLPALDVAGVHASQGSACSSGSPTPPRVLLAMGLDEENARRCVRFSFAPCISDDDAFRAADAVGAAVDRLVKRP
jgi:cysteine desulfurase